MTSSSTHHQNRGSSSSSHSGGICTIGGHKCADEFIYNGTTYKHKCVPLIGNRTWCLLKHELNKTEHLQLGVNYDECKTCPPHVKHVNHHIPLWISFASMFVFITFNFLVVYHLFDKQMFCFKHNPRTATKEILITASSSAFLPFTCTSQQGTTHKIEIISENKIYRDDSKSSSIKSSDEN